MPDRRKRPKSRVSRDQVRAWLGTVIAPIVDGLRVELTCAEKRDWSFRCSTRDFEYLCSVSRMVAPVFEPNLIQFLKHFKSLSERVASHDEALGSLLTACERAFEAVLGSREILDLAVRTPAEQRDREYFAEYIVNGLRDLPSYYTYVDIWREKGSAFLDLRKSPALAPTFAELDRAGDAFARAVREITRLMQETQQALADEHRLPPVDPAEARAL